MSRLLYRLSYTALRAICNGDVAAWNAESDTTGNPASPLTESNR